MEARSHGVMLRRRSHLELLTEEREDISPSRVSLWCFGFLRFTPGPPSSLPHWPSHAQRGDRLEQGVLVKACHWSGGEGIGSCSVLPLARSSPAMKSGACFFEADDAQRSPTFDNPASLSTQRLHRRHNSASFSRLGSLSRVSS